MKSTKCLITSIACLVLSMYVLLVGVIDRHQYISAIISDVFAIAFLVFFILGWILKDKPRPPRSAPNEIKENDKTE